MIKYLILTGLLLLVAVIMATSAGYNYTIDAEVGAYRGHYKLDKGIPYILEEGKQYRLFLAPQEALDTLGVALVNGDSLYVEAAPLKDGLLVTRLITGEDSANIWSLRDYNLMYNYYDEPAKTTVDPKKCIGCKLCVAPCPVSAITMVKGKAVIDTVKCVECGICIDGNGKFKGCPVKAITK